MSDTEHSTEHDSEQATKKIANYLTGLTARTGLDLSFDIQQRKHDAPPDSAMSRENPEPVAAINPPAITVDFTGPDTPLLLARNGELLHAIEHLAAKILGLEPEEHDRISFDTEGYKASRDRELARSAETAIQQVRTSGRPFSFPPMTSRERRMLHLILTRSGLPTASSGENPRRFVVLYPEGFVSASQPPALRSDTGDTSLSGSAAERAAAVRNRFRRR